MRTCVLLSLLLVITIQIRLQNNTDYSVFQHGHRFKIIPGKHQHALAHGKFQDLTQEVGWGKLSLFSDEYHKLSARALGFLEGALTSNKVYLELQNTLSGIVERPKQYEQFLLDQFNWTWEQIHSNQGDKYWQEIERIMIFLDGLLEGINEFADQGEHLSLIDLLYIQAVGDNIELFDIFNVSKVNATKSSHMKFLLDNHCSVLLKQVKNEVFLGHTTWTSYNQLLRVYKFYKFGDQVDISYSGYFGIIFSNDDYYTLNKKKIYVTETTNDVLNKTLLKYITPKSIFTWQRAMAANYLANSGQEWVDIFAQFNSGTYNNQYMIVDASKFDNETSTAQPGFLWIIEQMPAKTTAADVTSVFNQNNGSWVSHNIPYFEDIYEYAGYDYEKSIHGDEYSYTKCPRAQIFARDQQNVVDLDSYKYIMRYNKYQTDPLSLGDATNQIAARADLNDGNEFALFGAIDCKVTTLSRLNQGIQSDIQSGPTYYDQNVFNWNSFPQAKGNLGQPRKFDFPWVQLTSDY